MNKNETGVSDAAEIVKITVVHLVGGLTARMMGDQTTPLRTAKGWKKFAGVSGENDLWIYCPDVRLMEVAEGTIKRGAPGDAPQPDVPAGEFRPVDLKVE